jgi:superfamily II DNA or RNA helicase
MVQEDTSKGRSGDSQNLDALREEITKNALFKWEKSNYRGIFEWVTGLGKTKAAIEAIKIMYNKDKDCKILYFCPTIAIIANTKEEFKKFDCEYLLDNIEFSCYASIKNYYSRKFTLVVFDEIHNLSSSLRLLYLSHCRNAYLLGLSAKVPLKTLWKLSKFLNVVDSQQLKDVKGLVANFKVINVPVKFTVEEKQQYVKLTDSINDYKMRTGTDNWKLIGKRKTLINSAKSKIEAVKYLVSLFTDEKGIIFSLASDTADLFKNDKCIAVHNKVSKKVIENAVTSFNNLKAPAQLSVVRMYDEGVTIKELSYAIIHSSFSTETQFIQRVGRTLRKDTDTTSLVFRVYLENTVEEKWLENSQKSFTNIIHLTDIENARNVIKERNN